jgi:nifR3 family TIM-barrel protein
MTQQLQLNQKSLILAPLEGITDATYRNFIRDFLGGWDFYFTDFLRIPQCSSKKSSYISEHLGVVPHFENTVLQILTSQKDAIEPTVKKAYDLGVKWIDLNLGCPANRVVLHQGGSYLLQDLLALKKILKIIRQSFPGIFSVKMRIGFKDDKNFFDLLHLIEDEGVEALTLHPRIRTQFYQGKSDWNYIKQAVEEIKIPVIGNGDIDTLEDIDRMFQETSCHSVMIGRGALRSPWLASFYKSQRKNPYTDSERKAFLFSYFDGFQKACLEAQLSHEATLKRLKSLCFNFFEKDEEELKRKVLRSQAISHFMEAVADFGDRACNLEKK